MPSHEPEYRLYHDLAGWWPLISPPGEYTEEAAYLAAVLGTTAAITVHEVLDVGSGGGHIAAHLKDRFSLTLVDISEDMLAVSIRLNPECKHVRADMRWMWLGQQFDAVLVHDAIDYVTAEDDLASVIAIAFAHCRPGGVAVFVPDYTKDDFREIVGSGGGGTDTTGRYATFRERTWDPEPADDWVQADYEFILRAEDGSTEVIRESHRLGAFSRETWRRLLTGAGFAAGSARAGYVAPALPGQAPYNLFVAHRPL
jgi:SAM-dependent methyltransferase